MATIEDFQKLDIRTGVIVEVEDFPRARKPAYRILVDFGPEIGKKRSSVQATNYTKEELTGMGGGGQPAAQEHRRLPVGGAGAGSTWG